MALPSPWPMVSSLPPASPRSNADQRSVPPASQMSYVYERDCSNPRWAPSVGPHPRQGHVDPCVNNVEFQGVTIEWSDDDVGFECQGDNFGPDGLMYHGRDRFPCYGHPRSMFYGPIMREDFVEHGGHRWWSTKPRAHVVQE